MWNDEAKQRAEQIARKLLDESRASDVETRLAASAAAADSIRRERIEKLLDGAAAGIEHAKAAAREALAIAKTEDGRASLRNLLGVLDVLADDARSAHSSGEICAAYEAEVRS